MLLTIIRNNSQQRIISFLLLLFLLSSCYTHNTSYAFVSSYVNRSINKKIKLNHYFHHALPASVIKRSSNLRRTRHDDTSSFVQLSSSSDNNNHNNMNDVDAKNIIIQSVPSPSSIWEYMATILLGKSFDIDNNNENGNNNNNKMTFDEAREYAQAVTILRAGLPSLTLAIIAKIIYPSLSILIASIINDDNVFNVISQDLGQYIQNILTTSGLVFALLIGQTYYFMYQQQEATFLALYEEVTMTKSLVEQIALISQGRDILCKKILLCINQYVQTDLMKFNEIDPAILISQRPIDDPLEDILYLTSVGEPSIVYATVKSLRIARAHRLGALQKKLPNIHMTLLWVLFTIVLLTFPLLGAGCYYTIGGIQILQIQSYYIGFIVFGMALVMGIIYELQKPSEIGAYNARNVLYVMTQGLQQDLYERMNGTLRNRNQYSTMEMESDFSGPTIDSDGYFEQSKLIPGSGSM